MPSDLTFGSPMAKRAKVPESTQDNTLEASRFDGAVDEEEPNLDFFPSFGGLEEPELPPTPTQLGMEPAPGRPKGLLSSSPSTRHAKRARRRMVDTRKPSPSKLRGVDTEGQMEDLPGLSQGESLFTEVISTKQKQKRELSAELQQLNDEIAELQELTDRLNESSKPEAVDLNKLM